MESSTRLALPRGARWAGLQLCLLVPVEPLLPAYRLHHSAHPVPSSIGRRWPMGPDLAQHRCNPSSASPWEPARRGAEGHGRPGTEADGAVRCTVRRVYTVVLRVVVAGKWPSL